MAARNYYIILNIPETASPDEVKAAYRKLAFRYHPDHSRGGLSSIDRFREIKEAYETLSDPIRRRHHDAMLRQHRFQPYAPSYEMFKYSAPPDLRQKEEKTAPKETAKASSPWNVSALLPIVLFIVCLAFLQLIMHPPVWLQKYLGTVPSQEVPARQLP